MKTDGTYTEVVNAYFRYLGDLVGADTIAEGNYWHLLRKLHNTQFYWTNRMDENRALDGENLRVRFFYDNHTLDDDYEEFLFEPCSVLEMLVALALRMEKEYLMDWRPGSRDKTAERFWMLIDNLGLSDCTDDNWGTKINAKVQHYIEQFLDRDYRFDGAGGLFPLKNCQEDQRNIEIWSQMQAYIMENYWPF